MSPTLLFAAFPIKTSKSRVILSPSPELLLVSSVEMVQQALFASPNIAPLATSSESLSLAVPSEDSQETLSALSKSETLELQPQPQNPPSSSAVVQQSNHPRGQDLLDQKEKKEIRF